MHKPLPVRVIATPELFVNEHVGRDLVKPFSDEFAIGEYWRVIMGDMELCGMAKDHSVKTAYNPICGISKIVRQKGGRCRGSSCKVTVGRHWKRIPLLGRTYCHSSASTIIVDLPHNVLTYNLKHAELVVPSSLLRTVYCMQRHAHQDLGSSDQG